MRLLELRSNPDKNKKGYLVDELNKYKGRSDVFVSFTSDVGKLSHNSVGRNASGSKIGINPQTTYETPIGIYCYPLEHIFNHIRKNGQIGAEFTGSEPWKYLWVLQSTSTSILTNSASNEDYQQCVDVLSEHFDKPNSSIGSWDNLVTDARDTAYDDSPFGFIWNLTRMVANQVSADYRSKPHVVWTTLLRMIGYDLAVDWGSGIIHDNEPTQAVFFNTKSYKPLEVLNSDSTWDRSYKHLVRTKPREKELSYDNYPEGFVVRLVMS
ncbi:MAG: hypothetical protein EOO61_15175, partial [Hymenobacter sp.]